MWLQEGCVVSTNREQRRRRYIGAGRSPRLVTTVQPPVSPSRLLPVVAVIAILVAGGFGGWHWWTASRAVADSGPWFAGYVDVTTTPRFEFEEPATTEEEDVVLSFIVASTDDFCEPSWGTHYGLDEASSSLDLDRRIADLERAGGTATVSFGGFLNNELAVVCTNPAELAEAYAAVVERYDLTTIDLDIEGENLFNTAAGERRAAAIREVQAERLADGRRLDVWLTLPVATFGMTAQGTTAVTQMLDAGVDLAGVNAMTMNYGTSRGVVESMAGATTRALTATHDQLRVIYNTAMPEGDTALTTAQLWSKIGATPMVGRNDIPGEIFTLADAAALNTFAQDKQLGRISMWSLNRDRTCGPNHPNLSGASPVCSGIDQAGQHFSTALGANLTGGTPRASATPTVPIGE
jgi:chitinase